MPKWLLSRTVTAAVPCSRALDTGFHRAIRRDHPQPAPGVERNRGRRLAHDAQARLGHDHAVPQMRDVMMQARHIVRLHAAQVDRDQHIRRDLRIRLIDSAAPERRDRKCTQGLCVDDGHMVSPLETLPR